MNIEEAIEILKNSKKLYLKEKIDSDILEEAIETLLTAYEYTAKLETENKMLKSELEKEKEKNKELSNSYDELAKECNEENRRCMLLAVENQDLKEKNKEYNMGVNNLISQIENAIDFMKTDKSKIKVDMYKQKEEDLRLEIVHLKKLLKEE